MSTDQAVLETALQALTNGACPIRGMTDGSKRPLGNWNEWQEHRPDLDQVQNWFQGGHPALGVVCGEVSGRLECLEIEGRAMGLWGPIKERMTGAGLIDLLIEIAAGYAEASPSGGVHFLYRIAGDSEMPGNTKLASRVVSGVVQVESMIETRGEGGFIMVAPSNGPTHPTGKPWLMMSGGWATACTITREQRDALVRICESFDEMPAMVIPPSPPRAVRPITGGTGWIDAALTEWTNANPIEAVLQRNGWQYLESDALGELWRRPGKDRGSCSARVNLNSRLHVFSTSTPFIAGGRGTTTYDALDVELTYRYGRPPSSDERVAVLRAETNAAPDEWAFVGPAVAPLANQPGRNGAPSTAIGNNHHQEGDEQSVALLNLPDEFWTARPMFAHIRTAAHAVLLPPDAVWGAFQARYATTIPRTLMLPDVVSGEATFDFISVLVAPSGGGKTGAMKTAKRLLDLPGGLYPKLWFDPPLGSGEGLVDAMLDQVTIDKVTTQVQIFEGIHFSVGEGSILAQLAERKGATIAQTLTSAWSGEALGSTNVKTNRRYIPAGDARITVVMGIQTALGGPLISDFSAELGLAQRLMFFSLVDPALATVAKPEWPGPVDVDLLDPNHWTARHAIKVCAEVRREVELRHRESKAHPERFDPLDAHRYLCQLKTAGILMYMDGRRDISVEDWELARMVVDASRRVRATIRETVQMAQRKVSETRTLAKVGETLAVEDAQRAKAIDRGARAMARMVAMTEGPVKRRDLKEATASRDRRVVSVDEMIEYAIERGWIVDNLDGTFGLGDSKPA